MAQNRRPLKTGDKVNLTLLISFCFFFFFDRNGSVVEDTIMDTIMLYQSIRF